ncbi:MAG: DUF4038 domain-containing protein, partial [Acidobacteria bacterium]|nr:DUF4038 domain-containing protein [Acidobacteriota bacterium]
MNRTIQTLFFIALACAVISQSANAQAQLPRLKVSDNQRFIVTTDGKPFFYLGDTAWELFHRTTRAEAEMYLKNRAAKGFTVIQAVALAELDGLNDPTPQGFRPLLNNDPTKPDMKDGANNDYWDHVDFIVKRAAELGMYIGFLPTWGDKWNRGRGAGPEVFNPQNAAVYGEWLGKRYKDATNIIWILGGDRALETDTHKEVIRAMAQGLRKGDGGTHLQTLHPRGGEGSSAHFHNDDWLDFNMRQNGHVTEFNGRYDKTREDYDRTPIKPVLDGEPIYEDHPVSFNAKERGHSVATDVRRPLYWDLFTGACGHTYGHHSVWQMWKPGRNPINAPLMSWAEALDQPGAAQMQHGRRLIESRPFVTRVPDDSLIVTHKPDAVEIPTAMPGAGLKRFVATRDSEGSYAMVYAPTGRKFKVNLAKLSGAKVRGWWFNPRDGKAMLIGEWAKTDAREFITPTPGED